MKRRNFVMGLLVVMACHVAPAMSWGAPPSSINYQGRLISGTNLYNGPATVIFRVYPNGDPLEIPVLDTTSTVNVVDGLYATAITPPDVDTAWSWLGTEVPGGWWLQVTINGQALEPMERILSVPYALMADKVSAGSIGSAQLAEGAVTSGKIAEGAVTSGKLANKSVTTDSLQASAVTGLKIAADAVTSAKIQDGTITAADVAPNVFWRTDGNSGLSYDAFIGSTDTATFEIRCMNEPAFHASLPFLHAGTAITLGHSNTIAGISAGAVIGGGFQNTIEHNNFHATLSGGLLNVIELEAQGSVVGGGEYNRIGTNAFCATLAGGYENLIATNACFGVLGGGRGNQVLGSNSVVCGGWSNIAAAQYIVVAGGRQNQALAADSAIGGGWLNVISNNATLSVVAGGSDNRAGAAQAFIGGGTGNRANGTCGLIGGGLENESRDQFSLVLGGDHNLAVGGNGYAAVLGGSFNKATGTHAVVAGGYNNRADQAGFVGGGADNKIDFYTHHSVIVGGSENMMEANQEHNAIGGGMRNWITASFNTIAGGISNTLYAPYSFIGGGMRNFCQGFFGVIGGGARNVVDGNYGTVGGGGTNYAGGFATVAGGANNRAEGAYGMIPGGRSNAVSTFYGFAAGYRAKANHQGAFVWADSTEEDFASTLPDQFNIRATNGVRMIGSTNVGSLTVAPLHSGDNRDAQVYLTEGESGTYGVFLKYDGAANQFTISGKNGATLYGPHLVVLRDSSKVGVGRVPAANALEVEGNASKTTAGEWLANSDASIKTDVRTITNALETLSALRPVRFRYTDDYRTRHPSVENRDYCNYIAQEYRTVFPESVVQGGEGLLMVDTYNTQPYLVRAVQELNGLVTELRQENEELRDRLTALEAKLR